MRSLLLTLKGAPAVGLLRTTPLSRNWGSERGLPVDRGYILKFLADYARDIRGHALEFENDLMIRKFGGAGVSQADVIHLTADNPHATIVADLAGGDKIPADTFNCIICTQVLQYVYDLHAAVRTLYRVLKPGGVVLVTAPGLQMIDRPLMQSCGEYWRFTDRSLRRLFEEAFPPDQVTVKTYGNALAAAAFLHGYAIEDLKKEDVDYCDPDYQVCIALRAVKSQPAALTRPGS